MSHAESAADISPSRRARRLARLAVAVDAVMSGLTLGILVAMSVLIFRIDWWEAPTQTTQIATYKIVDVNRVDWQGSCGKYSCTKTRLDVTVAVPTSAGTRNTTVILSRIDDHMVDRGTITLYRRPNGALSEEFVVDYTAWSRGGAATAIGVLLGAATGAAVSLRSRRRATHQPRHGAIA